MKLFYEGITRNTENPSIIQELKKAGYVEVVEEPVLQPDQEIKSEGGDPTSHKFPRPTIEQIYAMCEKAGVNPDEIKLVDNPTFAQVKAAIAAAKKAG